MPNPSSPAASLSAMTGRLDTALTTWAGRDESRAVPGVRQSANEAMAAVDDMITSLHRTRQQLAGEMRRYDDATAARVDAMLAESRKRREEGR
jgi:hypothetical protein